jgi:two-component system, NtrC family, sensor histidine kinase HydH
METFILATVSVIIAISLFVYKKNDPVQLSFATLCMAIFVHKTGVFFHGVFRAEFIRFVEYAGLLAIPPLTIRFCRNFLRNQTVFSKDDMVTTSLFSLAIGLSFFTPLHEFPYMQNLLHLYIAYVLLLDYLSLLGYIRHRATGVEKRRMGYLAIALPIAAILSAVDIFYYYGFGIPPLSNLVLAVLLYFILLIIAYPHLTELHELLAKALVVTIVTIFSVILFYLVIGLFGQGANPPFTHILMACFSIVISISPFKIILEKIFRAIYPDSKDIFTSLYALDTKLERERSLLLEEMAPVFAHEIRNPLGSIKGAAQYLQSETDVTDNKRLLDVIIEEVDRLDSVVSQFLDYARPHKLNLKVQHINPLLERAAALIANNVSENVTLSLALDPQTPSISVDADQLMQVILNIAFNAIDAMPDGGTLYFRTSTIVSNPDETVGISIEDTGKGINKVDMKHIFKPFFTTKERGVGLGLAICQRIIKNHGGSIRVKSVPGKGTNFFIRLGGGYRK